MPDLDLDLDALEARFERITVSAALLQAHERWPAACAIAEEEGDTGHPASVLASLLDPPMEMVPGAWLGALEQAIDELEAWLEDERDESLGPLDELDPAMMDVLMEEGLDDEL